MNGVAASQKGSGRVFRKAGFMEFTPTEWIPGLTQFNPATRRLSIFTCSRIWIVVCAVGRVVIGGAKKPEVRLEIAQRAREVLEVVGKQSTVAELGDGRGIDGEQELGDEARLRKRAHANVEALQIHERSHDDLRARRGLENAVVELALGAHVLLEQLLAIVVIQQGATVEGIHDQEGLAGMRRPSEVASEREAGSVRGS